MQLRAGAEAWDLRRMARGRGAVGERTACERKEAEAGRSWHRGEGQGQGGSVGKGWPCDGDEARQMVRIKADASLGGPWPLEDLGTYPMWFWGDKG